MYLTDSKPQIHFMKIVKLTGLINVILCTGQNRWILSDDYMLSHLSTEEDDIHYDFHTVSNLYSSLPKEIRIDIYKVKKKLFNYICRKILIQIWNIYYFLKRSKE